MKKELYSKALMMLIAFGFGVSTSLAQDEAETLFKGNNPFTKEKVGFMVAPSYGLTSMDQSTASLLNLRGGINFSDKITIGGFFTTSLNQIQPSSEAIPNIYMDYWSVGGLFEYTLFAKKVVHLTLPLYVGYGEVQMDNETGITGLGEENFFTLEPTALLEVNLHKFVRLNLGAGYRILGNMNYRNFNQSDISGLIGYLGLKFGWFK